MLDILLGLLIFRYFEEHMPQIDYSSRKGLTGDRHLNVVNSLFKVLRIEEITPRETQRGERYED